ncbi:MAG: FG-GAP-like repeat-containing protein [Candidatus Marinimicrobia bacterium]|nr:FG-GAP-like repeat-containing protein [Candidatus Neomarinimicrobiota bacterium]
MLSKPIKIVIILSLLSVCFAQEWEFSDDFVTLEGSMGIEIDRNGLIWIGSFLPTETLISGEDTVGVSPIYVFSEDGTQTSFSPIYFIEYNSTIDTITACRAISQDSNGNILLTYRNTAHMNCVVKLDYQSAGCMNKRQLENITGRATSDNEGNVFVASILPGYPLEILDSDLNKIGEIDTLYSSYQRGVEVVQRGMHYEVFVGLLIESNPAKGGQIIRYSSDGGILGPWKKDSLHVLPAGWEESPLLNDLQFDDFGNMWIFFSGNNEGGLFRYDTTDYSIIDEVGSFKPRQEQAYIRGDSLSYLFDLSWTADGRTMYSADFFGSTIKKWHNSSLPNLFFSEIIEGSSNNKAIEIFNGSSVSVDLSNFRIAWCSNGCENNEWEYWHEFPANTIGPSDVWVMTTDAAVPSLINAADEILAYPSPVYINGDDVVGLFQISGSDSILLDVFGEYSSVDPGVGWSVAGVANATMNHTLIRKNSVKKGNTDWASSAGTDADDSEWIVMWQDYFGDIGKRGSFTPLTFQVDMSHETVSDNGVFLAGWFNEWLNYQSTPLSDEDLDGIYQVTLPNTQLGDTLVFKYLNGIDGWENNFDCPDYKGNRSFIVTTEYDTTPAYCFNECNPCDMQPSVTFQVDMANEIVSPNGVHVAGSFNAWDPSATELTDPDGDGIYSHTILNETYGLVKDDVIEYKFINNNSWDSGYEVDFNRKDTVSGGVDTLPPVCFNYLVPCAEIFTNRVWHVSTSGDDDFGDGTNNNPFATIQNAVASCRWDFQDTVIIHPGVYHENVNLWGKSLVLGSLFLVNQDTSFISATRIDGDSSQTVITSGFGFIENNIDIIGITIQNGSATFDDSGGGIRYTGFGRLILENLHIVNNSAKYGGGVSIETYEPSEIEFSNVVLRGNQATEGGGIYFYNSTGTIKNSLFDNNIASVNGSAIYVGNGSTIDVLNVTTYGNHGLVIYGEAGDKINLLNTIIGENIVPPIDWDDSICSSYYSVEQTGFFGSSNGNIVSDPLFINPDMNDYRLSESSPCIGSGIDSINIGAKWYYASGRDIDGNMRPNPVGSNPDIGAYESPLAEPANLGKSIESVYPTPNALNADQQTLISVSFREEIEPVMINSNTFVVHASQSGKHTGTYLYDSVTKTVSLKTNQPFAVGENVSVILTDGILTTNFEPIMPYQWEFKIASSAGPAIFNTEKELQINHNTRSMGLADFDRDGSPDLVIGRGEVDSMTVYMNDGKGNFRIDHSYYTIETPLSIVSADFTGDGYNDIASAAYFDSNKVIIYKNDGTGNFIVHSSADIVSPQQLLLSDIDNDGDIDMIVNHDDAMFQISTLINNSDGSFSPGKEYFFAESVTAAALADIDGDGSRDLIINHGYPKRIFVMNNDGAGNFLPGNEIDQVEGYTGSISTSDLDGDGDLDMLVPMDSTLIALINEGGFSFSTETLIVASDIILSCDISDLDGDKDQDLVMNYHAQNKFSYFLNSGSGNYKNQIDISLAAWGDVLEIRTFDFDGDGATDILARAQSALVMLINDDTLNQQGLAVTESISNYSTEQSGDILVEYVLSDEENDPLDILLEYSVDSGTNWDVASTAGITAGIGSDQYSGSIIWHSENDLPGIDSYSIRLKLTPNDGNIGVHAESNDFHLDNNWPPQISHLEIPDSIAVIALLEYSLSDAEGDTLSLDILYSKDLGENWVSGLVSAGLSMIPPDNYFNSLTWNTYESFGFQRLQNVWIKFMVSDNDPGSDTTVRDISILNYPAEYTGDLEITSEDLAIFASAWNSDPQDVVFEIGPATGSVPDLTPVPDGVLDFEDLAVFVQMWNWSYANHGLTKPGQLAKVSSGSSSWLDFEIHYPEDVWTSDGLTSVIIKTERDDILQVELIAEGTLSQLSINYKEGKYFTNRFKSTPIFKEVSPDSSLSSFCITGLELKEGQSGAGNIVELDLGNLTGSTQAVNLLYRLWSTSGAVVESGQINLEVESQLPNRYTLQQNFPNPFNPSTSIRYSLPEATRVNLSVFNIRGEMVDELVSQHQVPGYYQVRWDGDDRLGRKLSAGVYFIRLSTQKFSDTRKMIFLK